MCPSYGAEGCPLFRSCLSIEVNGWTVGIFGCVCYTVDVCYEVCLLSEPPLLQYLSGRKITYSHVDQ